MFEDIKKYSSFCSNFYTFYTFLYSAVTDYTLFLFKDIFQISIKESIKNIFFKVIQNIIFDDLQINIGSKNSPTLFFDILYHTIRIYEDICTGFRLDGLQWYKLHQVILYLTIIWRWWLIPAPIDTSTSKSFFSIRKNWMINTDWEIFTVIKRQD